MDATEMNKDRRRWPVLRNATKPFTNRSTPFVFILLLLIVTSARATQYGDIAVEATSPPTSERAHGYGEYRVTVSNRSSKDRHQINLILPLQSYSGTVSRTINVEPSSTVTASLFTSIPLSGSGLGVTIDGQLQRDAVPVSLSGYVYGYNNRPSILVSKGAAARSFDVQAAKVLKDADGKEQFSSAKSDRPVTEWGSAWLGYSGFDGIVVTADEMRLMPEPSTAAIVRYVECGGSLLVIGAWEPSQSWKTDKEQDGALSAYNAGFGICLVSETGAIEGLNAANWAVIGKSWEQSQIPWTSSGSLAFDVASANKDFPVTDNVNIPVRGLLLIMLVFVIVIGPVNLLILSKKKKRMWLLWTVPLISLLTCVAVSAYSIFSEGWGGRARYLSYTILDERSHRATTIGVNAFYTPLTPGDGLRYGTDTEITVQGTRYYSYPREVQNRDTDWTEGQHLQTGWVTARMPAHFLVRRSETRRERITMTSVGDGALAAVNGLGVQIRNLWIADEVGIIYRASNIAPGASVVLQKTGQRISTGKSNPMRSVFAGDWIYPVQQEASAANLVRPRTYLADLETCTFLEEGLKDARDRKHEARVYGIMKAAADEN